MPLGKEVKVMQCWRCKRYGHRTGDKECPFFIKGNQKLEQFRVAHEDPMYDIIRDNKRHEKDVRIQQLKQLLEDSTSDEDGSSSSSSEGKDGSTNLPSQMRVLTQSDKDVTCSTFSSQTLTKEQRKMQSEKVAG
ncbi:PREDICTED: retinitis pigmentosa 9 protein isoform X2 [Colobus angolensis palliatus]|uniref:retinitis pigmentosa 9 protein isoform X2 n=1 Tax=Colobus angolensis palliatus TaxID=336983 RepID=UPI0005F44838|nr:PREDICTED: retinitis pigmentosa 9 protein isoform X2 [Colobus angolensis palliatus]